MIVLDKYLFATADREVECAPLLANGDVLSAADSEKIRTCGQGKTCLRGGHLAYQTTIHHNLVGLTPM